MMTMGNESLVRRDECDHRNGTLAGRVTVLERAINGNGSDGLASSMAAIKRDVAHLAKQQSEMNDAMKRLVVTAAVIAGGMGGGISTAVKVFFP